MKGWSLWGLPGTKRITIKRLSRLPLRPRFSAGTGLLQKAKQLKHSPLVLEELRESSRAATGSKMPVARSGVQGAFKQDMFDGLDWPAAGAGNLFRGVSGVETLGVFPNESMGCSDAVKSTI